VEKQVIQQDLNATRKSKNNFLKNSFKNHFPDDEELDESATGTLVVQASSSNV
jgi:hypothetical protein